MSDRLDDDALLLILDELAAPSYDYDVYCANKEALHNVCLASHRLRRLAQPRLFRQIWVVKQSQADALKSSGVVDSLGKGTRWYTVRLRGYQDSLHAADVAHVLPNVKKLLLSHPSSPTSLARIASFAKLRHLSLVSSQLGGPSMIFTAPHLEQLDIHRGSVSSAGLAEWLQPVHLPALRILGVVGVSLGARSTYSELNKVLCSAMMAQLDVLQTDPFGLDPRSAHGLGTAPPVLFFKTYSGKPAFARHSIHPLEGDIAALTKWGAVRPLADALAQIMSSCAAIERPVVVVPRKILSLAAQHERLGTAIGHLEQAYGPNVRIIWSGEEGMDPESGGVSREFVEYARELKAAQRETAK